LNEKPSDQDKIHSSYKDSIQALFIYNPVLFIEYRNKTPQDFDAPEELIISVIRELHGSNRQVDGLDE
jgi:hypothetical protein